MQRNCFSRVLLIAVFLVAPKVADARWLPSWPHDLLLKEADLVVVATADKSEPTADKYEANYPYELDAINSRFTVKVSLKGTAPKGSFTVLHYQQGRLKPGKTIDDQYLAAKIAPHLVTFRSEPLRVEVGAIKVDVPEYLLYLKKRADGRYEPVSGQYDPALSVREMFSAGLSDNLRWAQEQSKPPKR